MSMTPGRARDAARLMGKLDPAEWVEVYGEDLINGYLAAVDGTGSAVSSLRRRQALAANLLQGALGEAISVFEQGVGGGNATRGRRSLKAGKMKPSNANAAHTVRFYAAVRLAMLTFLSSVQAKEGPRPAQPRDSASFDFALSALESVQLPDTATREQKERLRRAFEGLRAMTGALKGSDDIN